MIIKIFRHNTPDPLRCPSHLLKKNFGTFMQIAGYKCVYCGTKFEPSQKKALVIDHIIPWRLGGEDVLENFVASCRDCNGKKRTSRLPIFHEGLLLTLSARRADIFRKRVKNPENFPRPKACFYRMLEHREVAI